MTKKSIFVRFNGLAQYFYHQIISVKTITFTTPENVVTRNFDILLFGSLFSVSLSSALRENSSSGELRKLFRLF